MQASHSSLWEFLLKTRMDDFSGNVISDSSWKSLTITIDIIVITITIIIDITITTIHVVIITRV